MYFYNIHYCLWVFGIIGVHPEKRGSIVQISLHLTIVCLMTSIVYLTILLLVFKEEPLTITDFTTVFNSNLLLVHGLVKGSLLFHKKKSVDDLLKRMNQFWKVEHTEDPVQKNNHLNTYKTLKNVFHVYMFTSTITTLAFTCRSFVLEGNYLPYDAYIPEWTSFNKFLLYETVTFTFGNLFAACSFDMFFFTLLMLTQMQFKLLNEEIRDIFKVKTITEQNNMKLFHRRFRRCVEQHTFLLDYVRRINDTFSEGILMYQIIIIMSMGVNLYVLSTEESFTAALKAVTYLGNAMFQYIICYSIPAQAVFDKADEISTSVYFAKWQENLTQTVKMPILLMMTRAQQSVHITAGGFINMNMETCLKTIRTMVSYYMFLRTMGLQNRT